jgi:hypothetical protein
MSAVRDTCALTFKPLKECPRRAQRAGVPLQPTTVIGKANTDVAATYLGCQGIPTAGLGICRRYSHSPVELLDINDAVGTVRALVELCRTMGNADHRRHLGVNCAGLRKPPDVGSPSPYALRTSRSALSAAST